MKKEFEAPELEIIYFEDDDIITGSLPGDSYADEGDF